MNTSMQKLKLLVLFAGIVALVATGCSNTADEQPQTTDTDTAGPTVSTLNTSPPISNAAVSAQSAPSIEITNDATINSVDVLIMESFPVQVSAVIKGSLPDSCTTIGQVTQARNGNEFEVAIGTVKQTEAMCAERVEPFEQNVALDVLGLPSGSYTVIATGANSASNFFALDIDNTPPQIDPTPELVGASITGIVWHDACDALGSGSPPPGCVADENGNNRGNGAFDSTETRIPGVEVTLRSGECSSESEPIGQAKTDSAGNYLFTSLRAGTYCVGVNPSSPTNAPLLMPGKWTYPGVEVGNTTLTLAENGYQTADFGWDYQFDPPPEVVATPTPIPAVEDQTQACSDAAAYVADVTIPDGTVLSPGESFVKTWRVRNQGTCTWDSGYSLVFADGEQMGGSALVPLGQVVQPGAEAEISISLVAPTAPGSYRGDWLFQNATGATFGSRGDFPIYLQIVVSE